MWKRSGTVLVNRRILSSASFLKEKSTVGTAIAKESKIRIEGHQSNIPYISKRMLGGRKEQELIEILDDSLEEIFADPIQDVWNTSGDDDILMHVAGLEKKNFSYERPSVKKSEITSMKALDKLPSKYPVSEPVTHGGQSQISTSGQKKMEETPQILIPEATFEDQPQVQNIESLALNGPSKPRPSHHRQLTFLTQRQSMNEYVSAESRESSVAPEIGYKRVHAISLSEEQEHVIELARRKLNIFYTGSAGTGKSVLLRELIKTLKSMYGFEGAVAVTASTGLAACNISGITLHSFAGIGLGIGDESALLKKIRKSVKHKERWKNIKALVIDEISMIDGNLLDKLDGIAKTLRRSRKPFGGIQIILCGDFFQLPPVTKADKQMKFAFQSNAWKTAIDATIVLRKVFRQQGDHRFIEMLNEMRTGLISDATLNEFRELSRPLPNDDIIPAELFSTRAEVENANYSRLITLPGESMSYEASDGGAIDNEEIRKKLLDNFLAPKRLELKIGAQVMNIKNMDSTLVNGSLGKVLAFLDSDTFSFLKGPFTSTKVLDDEDVKKLSENPELEEYWSEEDDPTTKPTKQKKREIELEKDFLKAQQEHDNTESVLSDTVFDFFMTDTSKMSDRIRANFERKKEIVRNLHESARGARLPLVQFFTPSGEARIVLVRPETWAMEDEKDVPLVSRTQLPLILAWSLSIHKSQGQTLSKVKVDLKRVFEKGQAYVALSRAVSRDGLQILNFDRTKVKAHDVVVKFYESLLTAGAVMKDIEDKNPRTEPKSKVRKSSPPSVEPQKRNLESMLMRRVKKMKAKSYDEIPVVVDLAYDNVPENTLSQEN